MDFQLNFAVFYHVVIEKNRKDSAGRLKIVQSLLEDAVINDSLASKYRSGTNLIPPSRVEDISDSVIEERLKSVTDDPAAGASHLRTLVEGGSFRIIRNGKAETYTIRLIMDEAVRQEAVLLYDILNPFPFLIILFREAVVHFNGKPEKLSDEALEILHNMPEFENVPHQNNILNAFHLEETIRLAESGDTEAMYEAGLMYFYGIGNSAGRNFKEAYRYLRQVASGDTEYADKAKVFLSKMYYYGEVPDQKQSFKESFRLRKSIDQERIPGLYFNQLAFMILDGLGCDYPFEETDSFVKGSSPYLSNEAKLALANYYLRFGDYESAVSLLESIEENHPESQYILGELYFRGLHKSPPEPDPYKAIDCFYNAAESGYTDAFFMIGIINFRGSNGYRQNLNRARENFYKGAKAKHKRAQYYYAWMCRHGLGGERNNKEALDYFLMGAQQGHVFCMQELALLYQEPECKDYISAFKWAKKGTESGDLLCEFILGVLYYEGKGCPCDIDKALYHLKHAADHGIYEAQDFLAVIEQK